MDISRSLIVSIQNSYNYISGISIIGDDVSIWCHMYLLYETNSEFFENIFFGCAR